MTRNFKCLLIIAVMGIGLAGPNTGTIPARAAHDAAPVDCISHYQPTRAAGATGKEKRKSLRSRLRDIRLTAALLTPERLQLLLRAATNPDVQNWTFAHNNYKRKVVLHAGDYLTVRHHVLGFQRKDKGQLAHIDADSLYLINDMGYRHAYPRANIKEIKVHRKRSAAMTGLSVLLTIAGIVLIAVGVLAMIVFLALFPFGGGDNNESGCTVGLLLLLLAPLVFLLGRPKSIQEPFSERWTVTDSHATPAPEFEEPYFEMP